MNDALPAVMAEASFIYNKIFEQNYNVVMIVATAIGNS